MKFKYVSHEIYVYKKIMTYIKQHFDEKESNGKHFDMWEKNKAFRLQLNEIKINKNLNQRFYFPDLELQKLSNFCSCPFSYLLRLKKKTDETFRGISWERGAENMAEFDRDTAEKSSWWPWGAPTALFRCRQSEEEEEEDSQRKQKAYHKKREARRFLEC